MMGTDVYTILILFFLFGSGITQREVTLNSTLIRGHLALPGQRLVFTCVTRGSTLLEWRSNEHIGINGDDIQIYSVGSRDNVTSVTIPTTYATRVNVSVEDGVTVIVSQLFITASEQFPTSSVTCRIDGQGPRKTISFNILDEEPPSPKLNSTLEGVSACPGDSHQFECIALYSYNIEWTSHQYMYIGNRMVVTSTSPIGRPLKDSGNTDTYAVLDNEGQVNGGLQLTSSLHIVISPSIMERNHTITCLNSDLGTQQSMTFRMADDCVFEVTTNKVENNQDAAIIAGSIFGIIFGIILIAVIILAIMYSINHQGCYNITSKREIQDPEAQKTDVDVKELSQEQSEAEKEKKAEKSSPEEQAVQISDGTPNDVNSNQTNGQVAKNVTTTEAEMENKENKISDSDTVEDGPELHKDLEDYGESTNICSPSEDNKGMRSSVLPVSLSRMNSMEAA